MSDDLVKRLREHIAVVIDNRGNVFEEDALCDEAANRIEELEAKLSESEALLAKAVEALATILCNCVGDAERCGSKAAIEELSSVSCANLKGQDDE